MTDGVPTSGRSFSDLRNRVLTAVLLLAGFLSLYIWAAHDCRALWFFIPLAILIVGVSSFECARVVVSSDSGRSEGFRSPKVTLLALVLLFPAVWCGLQIHPPKICLTMTISNGYLPDLAISLLLSFLLLTGFVVFKGRKDIGSSRKLAADLFFVFPLVSVAGSLLIGLITMPNASQALLWLVAVTASNDTAAYFAGKRFGGPKLAPAISPNKTISGSTAGLILAVIIGSVAGGLISESIFSITSLIFSFTVTIAAQIADLMKSIIKRTHNIKDFSKILPGHGGVLDRVDAVLGGGAMLYICLLLRQHQGW